MMKNPIIHSQLREKRADRRAGRKGEGRGREAVEARQRTSRF